MGSKGKISLTSQSKGASKALFTGYECADQIHMGNNSYHSQDGFDLGQWGKGEGGRGEYIRKWTKQTETSSQGGKYGNNPTPNPADGAHKCLGRFFFWW